jgi:hypothetical protein
MHQFKHILEKDPILTDITVVITTTAVIATTSSDIIVKKALYISKKLMKQNFFLAPAPPELYSIFITLSPFISQFIKRNTLICVL